VIADHSPESVLETGLRMKAWEKMPAMRAKSSRRSFSLVWSGSGSRYREKPAFFAYFKSDAAEFSAVETAWRRERDSNPRYRFPGPLCLLVSRKVDLVISDHFLKGTTGTELSKAFKSIQPIVPIFILGGSIHNLNDLGEADEFMHKTDGPRALIEIAHRLIATSRQ
jgi:hypothetical protein